MSYKDPYIKKLKAKERKARWQKRERLQGTRRGAGSGKTDMTPIEREDKGRFTRAPPGAERGRKKRGALHLGKVAKKINEGGGGW